MNATIQPTGRRDGALARRGTEAMAPAQPADAAQKAGVGGRKHREQQLPEFLAGDIIIFDGKGDFYSRLGRWLMRTAGESPTYAVHTAQFLDRRTILDMDMVGRIKTMEDVLDKRNLLDLWQRRGFEVWRCRVLTDRQREALALQARAHAGVRFGMARGIMHLLDGLINKLVRDDVFLFRRLDRRNRYPVCSGITAITYDRALGYRFGVEPEWADPDHLHDWVKAHPDEWERVFCLEEYPHGSRLRAVARSTQR